MKINAGSGPIGRRFWRGDEAFAADIGGGNSRSRTAAGRGGQICWFACALHETGRRSTHPKADCGETRQGGTRRTGRDIVQRRRSGSAWGRRRAGLRFADGGIEVCAAGHESIEGACDAFVPVNAISGPRMQAHTAHAERTSIIAGNIIATQPLTGITSAMRNGDRLVQAGIGTSSSVNIVKVVMQWGKRLAHADAVPSSRRYDAGKGASACQTSGK